MTDRNRALIYIRKSLVRTGSDTVSPERQRAACLAEAERHGWTVRDSDIYTDAEGHQSGKSDTRPGWQALRRRIARDGSVAAVIVESLSRSSRNVRSFLAFVDELKARDVALVSLKERFDTSSAIGHAMLGFIAIINQLESDLAAERMKGQIAFKKSRGRHWGLTPMGCQREAVTGALLPSAESYRANGTEHTYHESLQRCYELYATDEYGFLRLAEALNAEGHRFRGRDGRPREWDRSKARACIAMCRVYEGWVPMEGSNKGRPAEWVRANFDPILPPELCRAAQRVWERRAGEIYHPDPPNVRESDYILTGILHCAHCGQALKGERGRHSGMRQYRHSRGKRGCPIWPFDADQIESQALELLGCLRFPAEVLQDLDALYPDDEPTGGASDLEGEREELRGRVRRLEGEIERLVELAITTHLSEAIYRRQLSRLNANLQEAGERLAEVDVRLGEELGETPSVGQRLRDLAGAVAQAEPATQRELLAAVFARVEVREVSAGRGKARVGRIEAVQPREWCRPFWRDSPGL
ncbi:MAG: recombinase family protein [Sideroxydans sp.]|nr:recombinase family protein [Sideroxydans sp.]